MEVLLNKYLLVNLSVNETPEVEVWYFDKVVVKDAVVAMLAV